MKRFRHASLTRLLGSVCLFAVIVSALVLYNHFAFAASNWRMGAGTGNPPALGFEPLGIDVDPINSHLFVADSDNGVVKIFDLDGNLTAWTLAPSPGSFTETMAVKFDGSGHVYVTDKSALYRFNVSYTNGAYSFSGMSKWDGSGVSLPVYNTLAYPQGIAVYGNDLYVADTNHDRVLKFDASTFSSTSTPVVWSSDLDPDPAKDATLVRPHGLAADSSGVYIGNNSNTAHKIIKVKPDGSTLIQTSVNYPRGFGLNADGNLYVATFDSGSGSLVTRYDSNLNKVSVYFSGSPSGIAPDAVAFDHTGALYLSSYAQSAPYDPEYDTIWKVSMGSPDNKLSGLTASGFTLSPSPFSPNTQDYTASVASSVIATTITPVLSDSTATVTVKGVSVANGTPSASIALSKGDNTIPVVVTAINGAPRTYTIKVTRAPYTDATLGGLTVSPGSLNEPFASGTPSYTANVADNVTSIGITPTVNNSRATVKVNGAAATSGSASTVSSLVVGPNTITVSVTAEDSTTTNDYTVVVTRAPSAVATLDSLTLSTGTLNEPFASGTLAYTANVANSVSSVSVTPTVSDNTASLKVNGSSAVSGSVYGPIPLNVGANTITVVVTAQDGVTTKPYSIIVTRAPSSVATLGSLTLSTGSLNEPFASGTLAYTANVANSVSTVNVTPVAAESFASITVNGVSAASGASFGPIPLNVGANTITIVVTAQDGVTKSSYRVDVLRRAENSSGTAVNSADLISLNLFANNGSIALSPAFRSDTLVYTAETAAQTVRLLAKTLYDHAKVSLSGKELLGEIAVDLLPGDNTFELMVTYPSGPSRTYTITIRRTSAETPVQPPGTGQPPIQPIALNDIAGNWAETEIRKAVADGWVAGYPDGSFHPEREVTRAEFVQLLAKSLKWSESQPSSMPNYTDIDDIGLWARPAIASAVQKGIINGYEDGSFRPARPLTRAEMTVLIVRSLELSPGLELQTSFADHADIASWAMPYIAEAAKRGLVNGLDDNRFEPNGTATRAQAVVIIARMLK